MSAAGGGTGILLRIAFRNLLAGRGKTLIIGGIILLGAALVVVGSSLLESVDRGMRASIQGSLGGHLQVYDARSKDDLALYGGMMGESVLHPLEDFARVKAAIAKVPNVKQVVPMGIDQAFVATGNQFDVVLEKLRADVTARLEGRGSPEVDARIESRKVHLRRMIGLLRQELSQARAIVDERSPDVKEMVENAASLQTAADDAFWARFDADPLDALEFLENRVAPLSLDGGFTFVRYVGTDLDAFMKAFDRTEIVEGRAVPKGQRGILLGKWYAEEWLKLRAAHLLDKIKTARDVHGRRIAKDEELSRWVREARGQTRDIQLQLDPLGAHEAAARLADALGQDEHDLEPLLHALFTLDDGNFDRHYAVFYERLAPLLQLYRIRIGDTITIKAPSKSGYMSSVNVKVYGFVQFRGLEQSSIAGVMSLMDLMSFRDLYGYLTEERAAEIERIQARSGARAVSREDAEAELFGGGGDLVAETKAAEIDEAKVLAPLGAPRQDAELFSRAYSTAEIEQGVALNAAVILRDPAQLRRTAVEIEQAGKAAGLTLEVVDWQKASGLVGQFVTLARVILYVSILIIFLVALVIINNAMVMATLQRVKEIGTMRAIGAQRGFVLAMLLLETVAIGLFFGAVGAAVGAGVLWGIRAAGGIPATTDQLAFFFSGPALLPTLGATSLAVALVIVFLVSVLSGIYPALLAMRVTPLEAMQAED